MQNQFCAIMDLNKCGCLVVEMRRSFNELKERLCSSFCHRWHNLSKSSERLSFYKEYKNSFESEKYVDFTWMDIYRNAFAQFRKRISQINDHRHRFPSTARNKSCPLCIEEIETETHFLLKCLMYTQLRRRYLTDPANVHDTRSHFLNLINSESQ